MNNLKRFLALVLAMSMMLTAVPFGAFAAESTALVVDASESENNVNAVADEGVMPLAATTGTTNIQPFSSGTANSSLFRIPAITTLSNGNLVAAADARWNNAADHGNIDTLVSISEDNGKTWNYSFANYIADYSDSYDIRAATIIDPALAVKTVDGVETIFMMVDLYPGQTNTSNCIANGLAGTGMDKAGHLLVSSTSATDLTAMDYYVGDFDNNMANLYTIDDDTDSGYDVDAWFNLYDSNGDKLGNLFTLNQTEFYVYQTSYLYLVKSTDGGETWSAPTLINHQVKASTEKFYGVGPASGIVTTDGTIMYTCYTYDGGDGKTSTIYSKDNGVTWERGAELSSQSSEAALAEANGVVYLFNRYGQCCYTSDYGETWTYLSSNAGYATGCEVSAMTYSKTIDGQTAILVCGPTSGRYGGKIFVGLVNDDKSINWKYNYAVNTTSDSFQYSSMTELADGSIGLLYENTSTAGITYTNITIDTIVGEDAVVGSEAKKITMYVGDTKTITLEGNQVRDNVTTDAADVTWVYSNDTVSVPAAQEGSDISFSGALEDLNDCLYTFTKNEDGTWVISAKVNGTTVYIDPYIYSDGGHPNRTYSTNVTLAETDCDSDGDTGITFGDGIGYLHFWDNSTTNLYWDNCTGNTCSGHELLIYKVADTSNTTTVLGGYFTQVSLSEITSGEQYLIVGHTISGYDADGYYALRPSTSTDDSDKWDHVAKITGNFTEVTENETTVTITAKAKGTTTVEIGGIKYEITVLNKDEVAVTKEVAVELYVGETETITVEGQQWGSGDNAGTTGSAYASVSWENYTKTWRIATATISASSSDTAYTGETINLDTCLYTFTGDSTNGYTVSATLESGSTVYLSMATGKHPNATTAKTIKLGDTGDGEVESDGTFKLYDTNIGRHLHFYSDTSKPYFDRCGTSCGANDTFMIFRLAKDGEEATYEALPGFVQITSAADITSGTAYLIVAYRNSTYYALHPTTDTSSYYYHVAKANGGASETTTTGTQITINGVSRGYTEVAVGDTLYKITVNKEGEPAVTKEVDVELYVGETETITDTTGSYADIYTGAGLDTDIATVTVTNGTVSNLTVDTSAATALEAGATYLIALDGYALTSKTGSTAWGTQTLAFETGLTGDSHKLWTLEADGDGYKLKSAAGYLNLGTGNNTAYVAETGETFTFTLSDSTWTIGNESGKYINALGGVTTYQSAGGWTTGTALTLYKVTITSDPTTEITITGDAVGKTSVVVGATRYNITVKYVEKTLRVATGGTVTAESYGTVTDEQIAAFNEANGTYATVAKNANGTLTFTGVAAGTVDAYILGGAKYTVEVYAAPTCVTSENTPFIVGSGFTGDGTETGEKNYLTRLTMSSVITQEYKTDGTGYYIELSDAFADATDVSWSIADESIAKIVTADDGKGVYVYAADANTAGTTYLTVTIDGESYTMPVVIIQTTTVTDESNWKYNSLHISEITNTTVWYSWNCSGDTGDFVEAVEGEAIWTVFGKSEQYCINFYGAPDARHALTFMSATNSEGQYLTLADKENPRNCDFFTKDGAGYREYTLSTFTQDQVAADIAAATSLGCDGAQGFSRSTTDTDSNVDCDLVFISDPMPELDKTIAGILPTTRKQADFRRYSDGMVASVGELVYFTLTVTLERPITWEDEENGIGAITYSAAELVDNLETAYFYTKEDDKADSADGETLDGVIIKENQKSVQDITDALNAAWTADEDVRVLSYYVLYEIQEKDIPKFTIDNVADLAWDYQSTYSSGKLAATANAKASITVTGVAIDDVVIDFGQIVKYENLTSASLSGVYTGADSKCTAKYGSATVTENADGTYTVTYIPTSILLEPDTVLIYGQFTDDKDTDDTSDDETYEKVINGFTVYPATTVYYEEGFMFNAASTDWITDEAEKATVVQTFELLGKSVFDPHGTLTGFESAKVNAYGYDDCYATGIGASNGSQATANKAGAATTFTFTGTGFDLYANCSGETGYVAVQVRDAAGKVVKVYTVNTVVKEAILAEGDSTDGQTGTMYSLPIISETALAHGTYTVSIVKSMNGDVNLDGIRIFNTVDESEFAVETTAAESPFAIDLEDFPEFYELRDYVLQAMSVSDTTSAEYGELAQMAKQVYAQISSDSEAPTSVILANGIYNTDVQNLLDNGPKNEVYLHKGETLVFNVKTDRKIQVGLKAPAASTTYSISYAVEGAEGSTEVAANESLNTSVDMFYELNNDIGTEQTYTITITNTGNNILSVTDLKICDDPNAAFVALTEENIKTALTVMGYSDSCEDSHSFENGFCAVCGIGTARNFTTGNEYGTVGEALAAAKEGETVILLTDCTESTVMVIPGVTLDLNGFKLTASYAVAMRSAHIIDSVGTGCLVTGIKSLVADEDNAMIPVYNGAGYVFTKAGFAIRQDSAYTGDGIKINALAYPVNMDVVELLKDGAADNNIEIVIRLTWDTADGTGSQDFKFTDEVVASVYSSNNGTWASYSKMFSMVVTGFENIENLKANIIVVSGTDAEYVSSSSVDIT